MKIRFRLGEAALQKRQKPFKQPPPEMHLHHLASIDPLLQGRFVCRPLRPVLKFEAGIVYPNSAPLSSVARQFADVALTLYKRTAQSTSQIRM